MKTYRPTTDDTIAPCDNPVSSDCVFIPETVNIPDVGIKPDFDRSVTDVLICMANRMKEQDEKIFLLEQELKYRNNE